MKKFYLLVLTVLLFAFSFGYEIKAGGQQEGDLQKFYQGLSLGSLDFALEPAGLAISAASSLDVKTTNSFKYMIDGVYYVMAPTSNISLNIIANHIGTQPISTYRKYLLSVNKSGAVTCNAGDWTAYNTAKLPIPSTGYAPFAYIKVLTGASMPYNIGTTSLNAVTAVYKNIRGLESGNRSMDLTDDSGISDDTSDSVSFDETFFGTKTFDDIVINGGDIDITSDNMVFRIVTASVSVSTGDIDIIIRSSTGAIYGIKATQL